MKTITKIATSVAIAVAALTGPALAEYPERPIEFVVPWPPGDIEDTLTRMIAKAVQEETGVPASTVNIKGGGGLIGATHVFSQPADGYTLGMFTGNIVSAHIIRGNAKYDREEFEPLAQIIGYPMMLATSADSPYSNLAELAEHAKFERREPGRVRAERTARPANDEDGRKHGLRVCQASRPMTRHPAFFSPTARLM